jgi:hypothetical protein
MKEFNFPKEWFYDEPTYYGIILTCSSFLIPFCCTFTIFLCFWKQIKKWATTKIQKFHEENQKEDGFGFITVPLTPQTNKKNPELPTTSDSPPPSYPINPNLYNENRFEKDMPTPILKTSKSVHFKH